MPYATTVDVSLSPGSAYTWDTAGFAWSGPDGGKTWDTANAVMYTLNIGEGWATGEARQQHYGLRLHEGWHTAEMWSQAFVCLTGEAWRMSECWADVWLSLVRVYESWIMSETASRPVTKRSRESWQTTDGLPVWNIRQAIAEAWNMAEADRETAEFRRWAKEAIAIGENPAREVKRPLVETFAFSGGLTISAVKGISEAWQTHDSAATRTFFERVLAELFSAVGSIAKAQSIPFCEAFQATEAYLRNANAVLSDIAFGTGDLSLADFLKLNSPAGYSSFTAFVPGELEYRKALISLVLNGPLTTGRPKITDWRLTVDVPDQTDSDTCAIPAANTFIPFSRRFFAPPEVFVQLRGGSTGVPNITDITDTGFYVKIDDAEGRPVAGDIVWSANGY